MEIPSFSDYVADKTLDGDKVRIDDILNQEVVITGYNVSESKYKKGGSDICVKVQFYELSDEKKARRVFFSGSVVLKNHLEEIKMKLEEKGLPLLFKATVKKEKNYYKLV